MNLPDPLEYLRRLWCTKPPTDEPPTCPECGRRGNSACSHPFHLVSDTCPDCGAARVFGLTADDPPISFTMHRCEGVQK